jgi:hypothetical protein
MHAGNFDPPESEDGDAHVQLHSRRRAPGDDAHELTPTRILNNAGLDPTMHYLVQLQGNHRESYQNRPDATIRVDEHMNIHLGFDRPTPVS